MTPGAESKVHSRRAGGSSNPGDKSFGSRLTIGYLAPRTGDNVSQALWRGVVDAAREHDANLICFAGDTLRNSAGYSPPDNVAYDLINPQVVDGLVSWASAVGGYFENEEIVSFHRKLRPLPVVSITLPMKGIPAVLIDSYHGMQDLLTHLIEFHGYRRLAFIPGFEGNYYAGERYRAYADALEAYGIPLDSNLISKRGDFARAAGAEGIRLLLDERKLRPKVDFDVVVTISDLPALGALEELQARGIRIPDDVALVGLNDVKEGRFVIPPLTSVKLPFYEQGKKAVEMLLALLAGEQVPAKVALPCELKVRQSCGCMLPSVIQGAAGLVTHQPSGTTFKTTLAARRKTVLDAMMQAAETSGKELAPGWEAILLDHFAAEVDGDPAATGTFLRELDHVLRQVMAEDGQVGNWQNVVSAMRRQMLPCFGDDDVDMLHRAEDIFVQAGILIGEAGQRARGYQMVKSARQTQTLRQISQALVTTFDVEELAKVLARDLPGLGIQRCYLSLYKDPQEPTGQARLILAFDEGRRIESEMDGRTFSADQLIPPVLLEQHGPHKPYSLVLQPLCFQEEQIGFVLFEVGPMDGSIYEVLRRQISGSLKGALLFDESRKARAAAEKADHLKTRLLANVSHELRAPLNVIIGCTREVQNLLTSSDIALPAVLLDDLQHIGHSAEHQLRVINDLLDLSRAEIDELDLYLELLDPRPFLEEVFRSMADANSLDDVTWHLQLPDRLPAIQADPVRLRQILLNLLSNAGKFVERGKIMLGAEVAPPDLHIWVQDTGPGVPLDMQERIFEPFVTAGHTNRRLEGVGLGLSITRRLVALHRGSMRLESQPGQGSIFHIYLPLPTLSDRPSAAPLAAQPVLLLISSHDQPARDIVQFSQRRGLEVFHLQASDDLDAVLQRVQPSVLAWDLVDADSGDWVIVRRLRNHPKLSRVPFILYGQESGGEAAMSVGMTDFVLKPADGDTLMEALDSLCPPENVGPILLIDDDPSILDLYQEVLARGYPEYPISTASAGAEALACMAEETPSLVILDLMMPEMDGFDVLDWMRANDRTRKVPVLVLSSRLLTRDDVERLERHARVTFQSKGILSEEEIIASLHRTLFGVDTLPHHTSVLVKRAVAYFHQNYDRALSRWEVAEAVGVSESYLSRVFRQELDLSPWEYLNRYRIFRAKGMLRRTNDTIKTVAYRVGFKDPAYFSRVFHKLTGLSPSGYRKQPE